MKDSIELSRRKVLGSIATVGAASAAAGAGTFAAFSDTESSSGNTIQAGTLDLGTVTDEVWEMTFPPGLAPGDTISGNLALANDGSINGDHVEVTAAVSENDSTPTPDSDTGDVSAQQFAKHLFVENLIYPDPGPGNRADDDDFFSPVVQLPGAFVFDVNEDGSKNAEIVPSADPAGSRSGVVHATSNGIATKDYTRSGIDVSDLGLSLGEITQLQFDWYEGPNNEIAAPDEAGLILKDGAGHHFVYQHWNNNTDHTEGTWQTRSVHDELDGTVTGNGWFETDLGGSGTQTSLGSDLLAHYSDAMLKQVAFGAGNFNLSNSRVIDIYYHNLVINAPSITQDIRQFRSLNTSLWDMTQTTIDNLAGIGAGDSETITMNFRLDPEVGNDFQADGVDAEFSFSLNQSPSQSL